MKRKILKSFMFVFLSLSLIGCATTQTSSINTSFDKGEKAYDAGKYDAAIKYFNDFLAQNPDSLLADVAMYYLGASYKSVGDNANAKAIFNKLIAEYKTGYWVGSAQRELQSIK